MKEACFLTYLTPTGDIDHNNINLLSGATTAPFLETMQWMSGGDAGTIQRVNDLFTALYSEGREMDMLDVLRILYGVAGMEFPQEIESLCDHAEARSCIIAK